MRPWRARRAGPPVPRAGGVLAGCRTRRRRSSGPGADAPWPEQRAGLAKLDYYSLTGRVAVAANGQGFSANLRYQQQPERSDLALDGPMGVGGMRMQLEGDELRIATSRGETARWCRGARRTRAAPGVRAAADRAALVVVRHSGAGQTRAIDADAASGEFPDFVQNGWRVSIDSRAPGLGFSLPQRLTAERDGARLKLLVEHWQP